jgi:pyruvate dehydrogenase E1 component
VPMVPFFVFYSMFGFQRVGDLIWAAADAQARGFLLGATAGRTTLLGEGLQHQDGHSHVLASTVPTCQAYDPAFAYEMATIVRAGITRMYDVGDPVFYYLTLYNENYPMPPRPEGVTDDDILEGLYRWAGPPDGLESKLTILFSGSAQSAAREAQAELATHHGIGAELWSATSYKRLREDALSVERRNRLHPDDEPAVAPATARLADAAGPIVAVTDFMKMVPDQIARFVPAGRSFVPLGTDGFGRSDTRQALRRFFETDAAHIEIAGLAALADAGAVDRAAVREAIKRHDVDPDTADPRTR